MYHVNTRRLLDVDSTFFRRYGRQIDVKITLCVHRICPYEVDAQQSEVMKT